MTSLGGAEDETSEVKALHAASPKPTSQKTMSPAESLRGQIADQGWGAGCEVPAPLRDAVQWRAGAFVPNETDIVLICSHPCDILCYDFVREPTVEVVIARPIAKLQSDKQFGRNPRTLQIQTDTCGLLELVVSDRGDLDRRLLGSQSSTLALPPADTRVMLDWLARRYFRSAFPDEFMKRLRPRLEKIRKLQEKAGSQLAGIWMRVLNNEKLAAGIEYDTVLATVVDSRNVPDMKAFSAFIKDVHEPLVQSIGSVEGIRLVSARCATDLTFYLQDIRHLDEFDVDHDLQYRL